MVALLSASHEEFIRRSLDAGEFESRERLFEEAIELLRTRREYVGSLLREAIEQLDRGEGIPAEQVFARLLKAVP